MADYTYDGAGTPPSTRRAASAANWAGAVVSLALIAGVGVWGYRLLVRDVTGVPVVQAMQGPMRVAPEDPGGARAENQGLSVNAVAGSGVAEDPADRLVLAPAAPGLASEDVALGDIAPVARPPMRATIVSATPGAADPQPSALVQPTTAQDPAAVPPGTYAQGATGIAGAAENVDDPIAQLAEQLAAGITPFTDLEPGKDVPVKASLGEAGADTTSAPRDAIPAGPGLARSLRPVKRPGGLQVASIAPVAPADTSTGVEDLDAAAISPGTRLVQIGAFDSPEIARSEWNRLRARFGEYLDGKTRVVQRASSGGRVFYRLRAHGFDDLADARRFCAAFVAQNVDCIPVVAR